MLAQVTAGIAINGIGKRGVSDFFTELGNQLLAAVYPIVNQSVQSIDLIFKNSFYFLV